MKNRKYINNDLNDIKSDAEKLEQFKQQRQYRNSLYSPSGEKYAKHSSSNPNSFNCLAILKFTHCFFITIY